MSFDQDGYASTAIGSKKMADVMTGSEKTGSSDEMIGSGRISRVVARARNRIRAAATLRGICRWIVTALGVWLAFFIVDNLLALPPGLRLPLAVAGGALLLGVFIREVVLPGLKPLRPERVAVLLEDRFGIKDNLLINAYQFERRHFGLAEKTFAGRAVSNCEAAVGGMDIGELWDMRRLWPWLVGATLVSLAWCAYVVAFPRFVANAGQRFALPLAEIAPPGAPIVTVSPVGDIVIAEGDSIEISAEVMDKRPVASDRGSPPVVVWIENGKSVPTVRGKGEEATMLPIKGRPGVWTHSFGAIRRPFAFRVFAAGTHSGVGVVSVHALPKITSSLFRVTPPAYTGLEPLSSAGPPAALSALVGSTIDVELAVGPRPAAVRWSDSAGPMNLVEKEGKWRTTRVLAAAISYEIDARMPKLNRDVVIARSQIQVGNDNAPRVEFVSGDRNRFAYPGTSVALSIRAGDDFGLKALWVTTRQAEGEAASRAEIKRWDYLGPPGPKGEVREEFRLAIDPTQFRVGEAYLVEAWTADFNPLGKPVASRPIVIRIRSPMETDLDRGDPLIPAFERLRQSLAAQERGIGLTGNLRGHLDEAVARQDLHEHRRAIGEAQGASAQAAKESLESFLADETGKTYATDLAPLVNGEMSLVLGDIEKLNLAEAAGAPTVVEQILERQTHIRDSLLALLGKIAEERRGKMSAERQAQTAEQPSAAESAKDVRAKLNSFVRDQAKILKQSKDLASRSDKDVRGADAGQFGQLARREARWAKTVREKAATIAKKETKEAGEESLVRNLESVAAQVEAAADALYKKEPNNALPHEQASLDAAAKLAKELDRQLAEQQEQQLLAGKTPKDESKELAGKIDDLLNQQSAIGNDVDKVSQNLMKPAAKGGERIGRKDAADGPSRSHVDFDGRSDGGVPGRAIGDMTGDASKAAQKMAGGQRLTPGSPDKSAQKGGDSKDPGGATGGGKAFGYSAAGLSGPGSTVPDASAPRLAEKQMEIRQQAEKLSMQLRSRRVASGDLENSVAAMRRVERALQAGDGFGINAAYNQAIDTLEQSREAMGTAAGVLRERSSLPPQLRGEIMSGLKDSVPQGYDEMISAYFRALAEGKRTTEADEATGKAKPSP